MLKKQYHMLFLQYTYEYQWDYYNSCVTLSGAIDNFRKTGAAEQQREKKKEILKKICKTVAGYIYKFSAENCIYEFIEVWQKIQYLCS